MERMRSRASRGFSLLELMIVVGILMVVAGIAIPSIMTTIADMRLRSAMVSTSGLVQQARMMAVKQNAFRKVRFAMAGSSGLAYIDVNDDTHPDADEPQIQMGGTVIPIPAPTTPPPLDSTTLGFTPTTGATGVNFNSRGMPALAVNSLPVGFAFYFTDSTIGSPRFAAVSVSPAGRVKVWVWNGSAWGD